MGNSQLLLAGGAVIIVVIMLDVVWTTLTTQGSGPIARLVTVGTDKIAKTALSIGGSRTVLTPVGPLAIILLSSIWLFSLWLGWVLVFSALPFGVVESPGGAPASLTERIYFVGFTLSTLGVGDLTPEGRVPMLLTVLASFNGLVLVTLVITYAVPLVQAAVMRRQLAFSISLLGGSPQEIAWVAWQKDNRQSFDDALETIASDVIQCAEQRVAYPMLDLFYDRKACFSLGLQLATLDEALNLLECGMQPEYRSQSLSGAKIRKVIAHYINRVYIHAGEANVVIPPLPNAPLLYKQRVPLLDNLVPAFETLSGRRLRLHMLVRREGWDWAMLEKDQ
ncbi:MAG: ion channel [Pseudomonadota bacterium]